MPSHRRTKFGVGELVINLIGLGFMMLVMFQFLPGGGRIKLASALENLGATVIGGFALLFIVFIGVRLITRSLRPRTPIERGNSTIFHNHVATAKPLLHSPVSKPPMAVAINISSQLRNIDWFQFEKVVALTYRKLGYNVEQRGGANPDGGIDLIIKKVGQRTAVQCKHWKNWDIGVKTVREFLGALKDSGIEHGILVTLNGYTADAKQLADKHGIEIISEAKLTQMLESTDARFDPEFDAIISEKFCPECNSNLVLRTAAKGVRTGEQFWGCSTFPRCHFKMAA